MNIADIFIQPGMNYNPVNDCSFMFSPLGYVCKTNNDIKPLPDPYQKIGSLAETAPEDRQELLDLLEDAFAGL